MARTRNDALPRNAFEEAMLLKGIHTEYLSLRWSKKHRRINQIRCAPEQLHIDAIRGIHKRRSQILPCKSNPNSNMEFNEVLLAKQLSVSYLSDRWSLSIRRINQIRQNPEVMHVDAIKGLPKYRKKSRS
tara:strand:- start:13829 stop:14218 length:390 start_codon:yes stop_codon:yes gene_type:complete